MPKVSPQHERLRREQILGAAAACFARAGYRSTSMDDVARESGLSIGAIYTYFASKEELLMALADQRIEASQQVLQTIFTQPSPIQQRLSAAIDYLFDELLADSRDVMRMALEFWEISLTSPALWARQMERVRNSRAFFQRLLEDSQRSGDVREDIDVASAVELLMALHDGLVLHRAADCQPVPIVALKRTYRALLNSGFSHPSRALAPSSSPPSQPDNASLCVPSEDSTPIDSVIPA